MNEENHRMGAHPPANPSPANMPPGGTQDIYYSRHDIVPLPMIERASGVQSSRYTAPLSRSSTRLLRVSHSTMWISLAPAAVEREATRAMRSPSGEKVKALASM